MDRAVLPDLDDVLVLVEVAVDRLQQVERGMRGDACLRIVQNRRSPQRASIP